MAETRISDVAAEDYDCSDEHGRACKVYAFAILSISTTRGGEERAAQVGTLYRLADGTEVLPNSGLRLFKVPSSGAIITRN